MSVLQISNLTKKFKQHEVIKNVNLEVPEHSIFGFLGENGSGKTTTMKMILGLLKPNNGEIKVCGEVVKYGDTKTNRYVGYLSDVPEFYGYMTPKEYLKLCGEITGMSASDIKARSDELLVLVGLGDIDKKIGGFSRGMKQRLGIAQALLNEPKLLILDEPTSALDPKGRKEILDILKQVKDRTTIIFSTHILFDVERICDRVAMLHEGKIVFSGELSKLKENHLNDSLFIEFEDELSFKKFIKLAEVEMLLQEVEYYSNGLTMKFSNLKESHMKIMELLVANKLTPLKIEVLEPTLESLFMEAIQ